MCVCFFFFFFKQKTAYEMRISDWSSDVCSSDLRFGLGRRGLGLARGALALGLLLGGRRVFGYRFDDRRLGGGFRLGIVRRRGFRLGIGLLPASAAAALGLRFRVFGFRIGRHRLGFGGRFRGAGVVRRSEERRVGKEGVRNCESLWA